MNEKTPVDKLDQQLDGLAELYLAIPPPKHLFERLKAGFLANKDSLTDAELELLAAAGKPIGPKPPGFEH